MRPLAPCLDSLQEIFQNRLRADRVKLFLEYQGFESKQLNGQRISINTQISEQDAQIIEKFPGNEVFVGHLPRDSFEDELFPHLIKAGRVYQIRWMLDFSGSNRGFAFVKYTTPFEAWRAISLLDNIRLRGHKRNPIGAKLSFDTKGLYFGNLHEALTCEGLIRALMRRGIDGMVGAIMNKDLRASSFFQAPHADSTLVDQLGYMRLDNNNSNNNRNGRRDQARGNNHQRHSNTINQGNNRPTNQGSSTNKEPSQPIGKYCYVLFESHRAATTARRLLIPGRATLLNRRLCIDWANYIIPDNVQTIPGFYRCTGHELDNHGAEAENSIFNMAHQNADIITHVDFNNNYPRSSSGASVVSNSGSGDHIYDIGQQQQQLQQQLQQQQNDMLMNRGPKSSQIWPNFVLPTRQSLGDLELLSGLSRPLGALV